MKCSNCPAYCHGAHYTDGSPIELIEIFCGIDFDAAPRNDCKRTLEEVKTILKAREGEQ